MKVITFVGLVVAGLAARNVISAYMLLMALICISPSTFKHMKNSEKSWSGQVESGQGEESGGLGLSFLHVSLNLQ
mgnify:CR=1 FL=1